MGRRPKPQEQKELEGHPGRRPLNTEAPDYEYDENLTCPANLKNEGRREWEALAPMLVKFGTLRKSDLRMFREYCSAVSELEVYKDRAAREKNLRIKMQLQDMVLKIRTQVRMFAVELGLSPASRGTIKPKRPSGKPDGTGGEIQESGNVRFFKKAKP